jgi:NAD-dependent dihydropyrimidine dehydrogenase PreA subunit
MTIIKRRQFLKTVAFACPFLAAGGGVLLQSQQKNEEKGLMVLDNVCTACKDCLEICPVDAITMKKDVAVIDTELCIECEECIDECPAEAIIYKKDLAAYKREHPDKFKPGGKDELPKLDEEKSVSVASFNIVGEWVMNGQSADGSSSAPELIRFVGTPSSGVLKDAVSGRTEGSYKISGSEIEIRLPGDLIARGRIVSSDRMEGTLPNGKWWAVRKK